MRLRVLDGGSVLPFGNRSVILTLTGAQLETAFLNGFAPFCDPAFAGGTGRFPQISGLKVRFHCNGTAPVVDTIWKAPAGVADPLTVLVGPTDTVRLVTNDFMFTGGDGYTVFAQARTSPSPATTSSRSPSTTSRRTHPSTRSWRAGSSSPDARAERVEAGRLAGLQRLRVPASRGPATIAG